MVGERSGTWVTLERHSSTLFIAAGVRLVDRGHRGVQALILLGVGVVLRRDGSVLEHAESAPDTTA